jgi:sugar/nucleoside kinase (ribokinase family)
MAQPGSTRVLVIGDLIDDVLVVPEQAIRPDTDTPAKIVKREGGSAANFACWLGSAANRVGLGNKLTIDFMGRVAAADVDRHAKALARFGVTPLLQGDPERETGSIVVLVQGQERSFLTDRGANRGLDITELSEAQLANYDYLYLSGYSLFESLASDEVKRLIKRAKANSVTVVCDPGSAGFIEDFGVVRFLDTLAGVDIFLPSLEEARVLSGETSAELAAGWLAERFTTVVVTLGSAGACLAIEGQPTELIAAFAADVLDATGAGDAFAAGFIVGLAAGESASAAIISGARLGAIAVTSPGGRPQLSG